MHITGLFYCLLLARGHLSKCRYLSLILGLLIVVILLFGWGQEVLITWLNRVLDRSRDRLLVKLAHFYDLIYRDVARIIETVRSIFRSQLRLSFIRDCCCHLCLALGNILDVADEWGGLLCILLIQNVLVLTHALGLSYAILLAFLIPAPLIDLSLSQRCLFGYHQEGFLRPMRIFFEFRKQLVKLVCSLSFSFPYKPLHLTCLLIKDISSALLVEAWIQWLVVHRFISCEAHVLSDALFVCFDHLSRVSGDLLVHWLIVDLRFFLVFTFSWCYFLHNLSILRP